MVQMYTMNWKHNCGENTAVNVLVSVARSNDPVEIMYKDVAIPYPSGIVLELYGKIIYICLVLSRHWITQYEKFQKANSL